MLFGIFLVAVGVVLFLVPLEDQTCPQISADLVGRSNPTLVRFTLWQCLGAIFTAAQREREDADRDRQRRILAAQRAAEFTARQVEQAELAAKLAAQQQRDDRIHAENEAALVAQVKDAACQRLANWDTVISLNLVHGKGDLFLFGFSADCEGCPYQHTPDWHRSDGSHYCRPDEESCEEKVRAVTVLFRTQRFGSSAVLRAWLGCPG